MTLTSDNSNPEFNLQGSNLQDSNLQGIAVIGMAGRFPGAASVDQFWHNLCKGQETITPFSDEELLARGVAPALLNHPNFVKAGSVLADIDQFDAHFFTCSPREAEAMDPQHRIFLETAWEALEDAGYDPNPYKGWIGVYGGANISTYLPRGANHGHNPLEILCGNDKDYLPPRVSYKLNLKGPSVNVSTACSTSLVAVHFACRGLLNYECDMALAGGVAVQIPQAGYWYQKDGIASPDGHCRPFDAKAQGTVIGNGVGIVVLKRLEDAIADGDRIDAVIRSSAINNDGASKVGFTAPSVSGQMKVIAEAQAIANIDPRTITYVETHGTGTALGDPIEISALTKAFKLGLEEAGHATDGANSPKNWCGIGGVKSNVGHLNSASGIAGFIKTVLCLKHQKIPPSLHFEQANPEINFDQSPFYVNTQLQPWHTNGIPRRAGISSFGFGGTNAHAILEEAPVLAPASPTPGPHLLVLSAKTASALDLLKTNLAIHLKSQTHLNLVDVAYTLQVGRQPFPHRCAFLAQNLAEAITQLETSSGKSLAPRPGVNPQLIDLGQRWLGGETIDWSSLYTDQRRYRVALPTYPFERQSYWLGDHRQIPVPEAVQLSNSQPSNSQPSNSQPNSQKPGQETSAASLTATVATPGTTPGTTPAVLPAPVKQYPRPNLPTPYMAPSNSLEEQIVTLWQEVLRVEQVGIHDNFFELGGDSLIATQLVARIQATFPIEVPLKDLLADASTVSKQAEMIEALLLEKIEELSEEEAALLLAIH
jgi:acyl transferase domain-containing protein/acyl carrier protein